jgi:hypothetical protein
MFLWQSFAKWLLLLTHQINNITPPTPSPNWTNQNLQNPSVYHLFQVKVLTVPFASLTVLLLIFSTSTNLYDQANRIKWIAIFYSYTRMLLQYVIYPFTGYSTHFQVGGQQLGTGQIARLKWIFPWLPCFQKRKCQSESKLRLCFA